MVNRNTAARGQTQSELGADILDNWKNSSAPEWLKNKTEIDHP